MVSKSIFLIYLVAVFNISSILALTVRSNPQSGKLLATGPSLRMGIDSHCNGSFLCPFYDISFNRILDYFKEWAETALHDDDVYAPGKQILCSKARLTSRRAGFCAFTQFGDQPSVSITGAQIKQKIKDLLHYGCFACGFTPFEMGAFKVDYVKTIDCTSKPKWALCDPTTKGATDDSDPRNDLLPGVLSLLSNTTVMS